MATLPAVNGAKTPVLIAFGALIAVAGCGGGGGSSDKGFRQRADAVCARANRASPKLDGSSPEALLRTIERLTRASEVQARSLARLRPPSAEEADFEQLVTTFEQRTRLLRNVRAATRSDGAAGFNRALRENAQDGRSTNDDANRIARGLALDKCVQSTPGD